MLRYLLYLLVGLSSQEVTFDIVSNNNPDCAHACCYHSTDSTMVVKSTDSFVVTSEQLNTFHMLEMELEMEINRSQTLLATRKMSKIKK